MRRPPLKALEQIKNYSIKHNADNVILENVMILRMTSWILSDAYYNALLRVIGRYGRR